MRPGARTIKRVAVRIAVVGAAACFAPAGWVTWRLGYGLPLVVDVRPGEVVVDTRRLGEYGSEVSRIRLSRERDDVTVWEAVSSADDGTSLLWQFTLDPGPNAPPEGTRAGFRTRVPVAGDLFQVEAGQRYRIEVWGSSSLRHGVSRFVAPAPRVASEGALSRHALLTADWRLFGGVFEILPGEGYPMRFAENGTMSSENLVGVDGWSLESGVLRLSGGGTTMYEFTWLPDARAFRACAVPMPPLIIVPSGRSLKDVLELRCTRSESGTSGRIVAPNRSDGPTTMCWMVHLGSDRELPTVASEVFRLCRGDEAEVAADLESLADAPPELREGAPKNWLARRGSVDALRTYPETEVRAGPVILFSGYHDDVDRPPAVGEDVTPPPGGIVPTSCRAPWRSGFAGGGRSERT